MQMSPIAQPSSLRTKNKCQLAVFSYTGDRIISMPGAVVAQSMSPFCSLYTCCLRAGLSLVVTLYPDLRPGVREHSISIQGMTAGSSHIFGGKGDPGSQELASPELSQRERPQQFSSVF